MSWIAIRRISVVPLGLGVLWLLVTQAGEVQSSGASPAPEQEQLPERDRLAKQVDELRQAGKFDQAVPVAERILELERQAGGGMTMRVAEALSRLAELHEPRGDWRRALELRREAVSVRERVDGKDHWRMADARLALAFAEKVAGLGAADRAKVQAALRKEQEATRLFAQSKYEQVERVTLEVLATYQAMVGPETAEVARAWHLIGRTHLRRGDPRGAKEPNAQALRIRREVLPAGHPDIAGSLNNLGFAHSLSRDYVAARRFHEEALAIRRKALPRDHPDLAQSLNNLGLVQRELREYAAARANHEQALAIFRKTRPKDHPDLAISLNNLGNVHEDLREYAAAKKSYEEALAIFRKALPADHPDLAQSLHNLGILNYRLRDLAAARKNFEEALAIRRKTLPPGHPDIAQSLNNLGRLQQDLGEYGAAKKNYEEALAIRRKALPPGDPSIAHSLNNLGWVQRELRQYAAAEKCYEDALAIYRGAPTKYLPDMAESLDGLALVQAAMRDYGAARKNHEQATAILRRSVPKNDPRIAASLTELGNLQWHLREFAAAKRNHEEALGIYRQALPKDDPLVALCLNNLGNLQYELKAYEAAEKCYEEALAIFRKTLLEGHPYITQTLNNLGYTQRARRNYTAAKRSLEEALALRRKTLPADHPHLGQSLGALATLHRDLGDYRAARKGLEESIAIYRRTLPKDDFLIAADLLQLGEMDLALGNDLGGTASRLTEATDLLLTNQLRFAVTQAEREQLLAADLTKDCLHLLLTAATPAGADPIQLYDRVVRIKGSVTAQQRWSREARDLIEPDGARLLDQLRKVTQQFVVLSVRQRLANRRSDQQDMTDLIRTLSDQRDQLERQLTEQSAAYRTFQARSRAGATEVRTALPNDTALIDVVGYRHVIGGAGRPRILQQQRIVAFVVRPDRPGVVIVPLSPTQVLSELIERWRASYGAGKGPPADAADPGAELRKRLWEPLVKHLRGVKVVLVSPDGPLNGLPLAALPGSKPGTFLLHEYAFATVPVPQLLPDLLRGGTGQKTDPASLVVGDIDFDALPDHAAPAARQNHFSPLPGTRAEATAVHELFRATCAGRPAELLTGKAATEQAFVSRATNCSHLLVATHGFFLPEPERKELPPGGQLRSLDGMLFRSELVMANPALRSGLVFAGANYEATGQGSAFLTAMQASELDLHRVDLAVLSACETGLGQIQGGEGALGLQRAFQLAGARTAVTSLWKVPDAATQALMTRFHRNLWEKRMPKLEALREAQLWMIQEGRKHPELGLRGGLERPEPKPNERDPVSPYYWAAFVLSGDWR
jgi:CHAT domain-containing protein/tetratricopeptide (TPR) repeat protein